MSDTIIPSGTFEPPWLIWARRYIGTVEIHGPTSEPLVEWFHAATTGGAAGDDVPWCSSFLCRAMQDQGMDHPRSKSSQAWRNWGAGVGPILGAVAVLSYGAGRGHVGIVTGRTLAGGVVLLGGNQGNAVSIKAFPTSRIIGYRWPRAPLVDDPGAAASTR